MRQIETVRKIQLLHPDLYQHKPLLLVFIHAPKPIFKTVGALPPSGAYDRPTPT